VRKADKNTVIIGDFNLPGTDWANERSDLKGRELMDTVQEEGFEQLVSFPTHTKGNILDLVLSNCPEKILDIEDVGRLGHSDHCMLKVVIEFNPSTTERPAPRFNWSKADTETMKRDISEVNWRLELEDRTVEESWRFFRKKLSETVEKNIPKCGERTKLKNPWMTREILRLIRRKRRKWKEVKNSASAEEMRQYKQLEKETTKKIRNAKRKMEKNLAYSEDKNNRKFARYIKSKTKSRTTIGPLITKEKKMLTEDKDMAEELNTFFASVFTKEDLHMIPEAEEEEVEVPMGPVVVTQQMIRRKIKKLRKEAAPGPDEITPGMLKMLEDEVLLPLEIIFNKSLSTAQVPLEWRTANVTPIFKKGTKGDPGNYRPVSLTSVPCKMLEAIVLSHLMENNLIGDSQHGFMPGKSCASNLVEFMDFVTDAVDKGKSVDIFYLDFSKAFDKVPHKRLVEKMKAKGIEDGVVRWIESWLSGRTQRVCIHGEKSGESPVDSGVPQGTVLGPPLFTIYIDDLEVEIKRQQLDVKIVKFADDTKGGKVVVNTEDRNKLQQALDGLCDWADKWGMSFNLEKCKVMHVGAHNPAFEYFMRGMRLEETEEERDIGVIVTKNLKPSAQCSKAAGRATAVLGQLRRNFHYRDRFTFLRLYKQYVRPHLEFSVPAWSPWLQGDKDTLEKVQEKAVKMVAGLKGDSYLEKCAELGLETLEKRRSDQDLALVYKFVTKSDGQALFSRQDGARTRQAAGGHGLTVQYARTDPRKYSFAVRTIDSWNRLPERVKTAETGESFKRRLRGKSE
jgi:hypothetical protein